MVALILPIPFIIPHNSSLTYTQLLNTISNLGGTWPKPLILRSVDILTKAYCSKGPAGTECVTEHGKNMCEKLKGDCVVHQDGYYIMSAVCVAVGVVLLMGFILPTVRRLQCEFDCSLFLFALYRFDLPIYRCPRNLTLWIQGKWLTSMQLYLYLLGELSYMLECNESV